MRTRLVRPVLLAALFLLALPAAAQRRTETPGRPYYIRGTVRLADSENPVEFLKVELRRFTGETLAATFTRTSGHFEFTGLTNGTYIVTIEQAGYEPIREQVEIISAPRVGLTLYLVAIPKLQPSGIGPSVSARELSLPSKALSAFRKGQELFYAKRDYAASLKQYERTLAELPSFYEAHYEMGMVYLNLARNVEAERSFRKAIELSKATYADPFFGLAALLSNEQRYSEAEQYAAAGLQIGPAAWQGHYELARASLALDHLDAALRAGLEARSRKPEFAPVYLLLANIYIRKRDYPALLENLEAYLRLEPDGPSSDQARQTRENIQKILAQQKAPPPTDSPKP